MTMEARPETTTVIQAEQEQLTRELLAESAKETTGVTRAAFSKTVKELLISKGDTRTLLRALRANLTSFHSPGFILSIHKALAHHGTHTILGEPDLDTAEDILKALHCYHTNLANPLAPAKAAEATKIVHYALTSPDRDTLTSIIKERSPETLDSLTAIIDTENSITAPLRRGAL